MMTKRNLNPKSLKNLRPGESPGRNKIHDSLKRSHGVTLTDVGWSGVQEIASNFGYSVSEFLEQIGRGQLAVLNANTIEAFQDALDLAEARAAIAEAQEEGVKPLEQVLAEMAIEV